MKKMFLAAMAIATIAMVGCKKGEDPVIPTPGPTPGPTSEVPEIAKPGDGYVTFALQIPEGTECNGIAVKGTTDGSNWTGADQYLAADGTIASGDAVAKFAAIPDFKNWYQVTIKLGAGYEATDAAGGAVTNYMAGKFCLIYAGDGSWDGQAVDWEYLDSECTVAISKSGDGNFQVNGTSGVVYVTIGGWNKSQCIKEEAKDRVITLKAPDFGGRDITPGIVGSFEGCSWAEAADARVAMTLSGDTWTATVKMVASDEFKIVSINDGWSVEIQQYDADGDAWNNLSNVKAGDQTTFDYDYSDAAKYRWTPAN